MRPSRPLLSLALALSVCGCGAHLRHVARKGEPIEVSVVAVYPFAFRWEQPAYRSFQLAHVVVEQLLESGRYAVMGPSEFKVLRATADNPFAGSDVVTAMADRGFSARAGLVVKPWAERREVSAVKQLYDEQGRPRGVQRVAEATLIVHVEIVHPFSREIVCDATGELELDPLATYEEGDPQPELTRLLRVLTQAVLGDLRERAPGQKVPRDPGFDFLYNPAAVLELADGPRPSLSASLASLDPLAQELQRNTFYRFFFPSADEALLSRLAGLPGGLLVTRVHGSATIAGLREGDVVLAVEGEPAQPQVLHRHFRRAPVGASVLVKVRRVGQELELRLPVSE